MAGSLIKVSSRCAQETFDIGIKIAAALEHGSVVSLNGELGSGKTCLAKGIAKGLGINENITSPTYAIINEYQGLNHIDAYRLNSEKEFEDIGGIDIINSESVSVIEWGQRISNCLPADTVIISFEITGADSRLITINGLEQI
jgi:tRNA threonylcarbamoyladenosine biosynthesis protein TsaE